MGGSSIWESFGSRDKDVNVRLLLDGEIMVLFIYHVICIENFEMDPFRFLLTISRRNLRSS